MKSTATILPTYRSAASPWIRPLHQSAASAPPARTIHVHADRRGSKSSGSDNKKRNGNSDVRGATPYRDANSKSRPNREQRQRERDADLQAAARRGSARAGSVSAGRAALHERQLQDVSSSSSQAEEGSREGPRPSAKPARPRPPTETAPDLMWPSREAVVGTPPPPSIPRTAEVAATVGLPPGGGTGSSSAAAGTSTTTTAAAGAAIAVTTADVGGGGRGGGRGVSRTSIGRAAEEGTWVGGGLGFGGSGGGQGGEGQQGNAGEVLEPYVDVALKTLGLPPRPTGRSSSSATRRHSANEPRYQVLQTTGQSGGNDEGSEEDDEEEAVGGGGSGSGRGVAGGGGRSRGARRGALRAVLEAYKAVWCRALDLELQEEWGESEERLRTWKRPRLEVEGVALFDLTPAPDHSLFRDAVLRFFVPGRPLPYHCLGPGDIVLVSPNNRPGESSLEGVVLDFSSRWLRVALPADLAAGVQGGGWRLDLYANRVAHERARAAVQRYCQTAAGSGNSSTNGNGGGGSSSGDEGRGAGSEAAGGAGGGGGDGGGNIELLRALAGVVPPGSSLEQIAAIAPAWIRGRLGRERLTAAGRVVAAMAAGRGGAGEGGRGSGGGGGGGGGGGLNPSQVRAVESALGRSLTLWQGPPGTGKTSTLLAFISAAAASRPSGSGPLLATAASNVAVDNIVAGLAGLGHGKGGGGGGGEGAAATGRVLDVVRVGQPVKVAPELRALSLEARIAATPGGQRAAQLRRQATGLRGSEAWGFISQALDMEEAAARDILSRADVVAATCIGCGEPRMQALSFPLVVLDEATQATEPHSLVPLLAQAQQIVLVGDPRQLPPTVKSREAEELGLGLPLFERLQLMGLTPLLLDTQYRMHPALAAFPAAAFYNSQLKSAPRPADRRPPPGFPWPQIKIPIAFIPVKGRESRTAAANDATTPGGAAGFSYFNAEEAEVVRQVVAALLAPGGGLMGPVDVGVITPYNGQVRCIQQLLVRGSRLPRGGPGAGAGMGLRPGGFVRGAARGGGGGGGGAEDDGSVLEIKSVDGFQGREKEVIVFSAVRSNPEHRLGFVSDPRRLNVALTRARRGLVVVGDPDTLAGDRLWSRWLGWVRAQGCELGGWGTGLNARGKQAEGGVAIGGRIQRDVEEVAAGEEEVDDVEMI